MTSLQVRSRWIAILAGGLLGLAARDARAAAAVVLTASPVVVTPGTAVTLAWTATDATACTASGGWSGPRATDGSEDVTPALTTTYALACDGPSGTGAKTVTVTVKGDECEELSTAVFPTPAAVRLFPFDVVDQDVVRVSVRPIDAGLALVWRLVAHDGSAAPDCGTDRPLTNIDCGPLPAALGPYTLVVTQSSGTGSANIGIQHLTRCNSTRIDCDQAAVDTIDPTQDSDLFRFSVTDGETVRLTTKKLDGTVQPEWRIVTAAGLPASDCTTFQAGWDDCGPLAAGEYQAQVRDRTATGTGRYAIHLQRLTAAAACDVVPLTCDQPTAADLDPGIDGDLFAFSAADGETVRITVEATGGSLVPEWRLLTAAGEPAPACGSFRTLRGLDCGPLTGDFQVEVKDDTLDKTGPYVVHLQRLTLAKACDSTPIICDRPLDAHIDPGADSDLFRFPVEDLEVVQVSVVATSGTLTPAWRLLTTDGTQAGFCNSFTTRTTPVSCGPLPAGEYQIQVKDDDAVDGGDYQVSLVYLVHQCPNCGNGIVTGDEQCDPPGPCCTATCQFVSAGTICRPVVGDCDVAETCSGDDAACPVDGFRDHTFTCRFAAGECDLAENCTGRGAACPVNALKSASFKCRPSAGPCDLAEFCTGSGVDCPPDAKDTGVCRPLAGPCDVAERCDGISADCPADGLQPPTTVCRPATGACDVAETCTGSDAACPPNLLRPPECGNGCLDPGEQCGETGLPGCPAGTTCTACVCAPCATAALLCPVPPARDGGLEVDLTLSVGSRALGSYAVDLAWDPSLLAVDAILGGSTPEFAAAPDCAVDATAGTARCTATQSARMDGPSGTMQVARIRMTAHGSPRATVNATLVAAADPDAAPIPLCSSDASCTVPLCTSLADCDDGDDCTDEQCLDGACQPPGPLGLQGVECELGGLLAKSVCGPAPLDGALDRVLRQKVAKARQTLAKTAAAPSPKKRTRLLKRVDRVLRAIVRKAEQSARQKRISRGCADALDRLVAERQQMVADLAQ